MKRKYIIEIDNNAAYPFDGIKQGFTETYVRIRSNSLAKVQNSQFSQKLNHLLKLNCENTIKIIEIQQFKGKQFIIMYQYVPYCLKISNRITQINQLNVIKQKCIETYQYLAQNRIKSNFHFDNIGFNAEGQLKIFVPFDFQIISEQQSNNLSLELQYQIDKSFQLQFPSLYQAASITLDNKSQISLKLCKKIEKIQQKLKSRNKNNRTGNSPNKSTESRKEKSKSKSSKDSHNSLTGPPSNSFIQPQKYRGKIHKSSFGDYTTTSHRLNQQQAYESNLKTRLHNALEKSQQTFKIYEKLSKYKY